MPAPTVAVVVCTRNRPEQLALTLAALEPELEPGFELVVVDQSEVPYLPASGSQVRVLHDRGRGLSRARNVALDATRTDWIAFVDDDCRVRIGWGAAVAATIAARPGAAMIAPRVEAGPLPVGEYLEVTTFPIDRAEMRRGKRLHPARLGFGVCTVVRRDVAVDLGGWDERLGPGAPYFPAADDMDFNYRLLRAGYVGWVTPDAIAVHDQWRTAAELPALHRGYLAAWSGFATKHLRTGDRIGGLRLLAIGVVDALDALKDAVLHPGRLSWRLARAKVVGLAGGTLRGLSRRW
jgi:GT2 family glycosyltransferase